ncbi:hypothetical protein FRC03_000283, partial [Tulasnella sp. 419]
MELQRDIRDGLLHVHRKTPGEQFWLTRFLTMHLPFFSLTRYPRTIPAGTAVPGWAYTDSRAGDDFDLNAAQSSVGVPESPAGTLPTGVSTAINGATTNAPAVSNA